MPELLPPLYQRWIEQLLPEGIPSETRATCSSCTMLPRGEAGDNDINFNPSTKCCTYHPDVHNFTAGNILADESPETYAGRRTLERRIAARIGVTPLSVSPPPVYQVLYNNSALAGPDVFGRAEALKCPFYIEHGGQCGIWLHRETVCSTFFCKYARGPAGRHFWRALAGFLGQLEHALRVWALNELDPSGALSIESLTFDSKKPAKSIDESGLAGILPPGLYERLWGPWAGREAELFRACAQLVNGLEYKQVLAIGGEMAAIAARTVSEMHKQLAARELPERLRRGSGHMIQLGKSPGTMRVKSQSAGYDFIDVPVEALGAATRVVDQPLGEARAELAAAGIELSDETLRWLIDFEVLLPG